MAKPENVKFTAPPGHLLIAAYREEANQFEREGKEHRARQYRRLADRMQAAVDAALKHRKPKQ